MARRPKPSQAKQGLESEKIQGIKSRIDEVDRQIQAAGAALATESNETVCRIHTSDIAELEKRKRHLAALLEKLERTNRDQFSEFAAFKYDLLDPQTSQALEDLGDLLQIPVSQLKTDFPAFVHVLNESEKRHILSEAIAKRQKADRHIEDLETQLAKSKEALAAVRQEAAARDLDIETLTNQGNEAHEQLILWREKHSDLESHSETQRKQWEIEYDALVAENQQLQDSVSELRAASSAILDEIQELEQNIKDLEEREAHQQADHQEQICQFKEALVQSKAEVATWAQKVETCLEEKASLRQKIRILEDEKRVAGERVQALAEEVHTLTDALDQSESERLAVQDTLNGLQEVHAELEAKLEKAESARTWHLKRILHVYQRHRQDWQSGKPQLIGDDALTYGYLIATVWLEVNDEKSKSATVFEDRMKSRLQEPDWQHRYLSEVQKRAARDAQAFQLGQLFYADTVPLRPATSYPEMYAQILDFATEGPAWRGQYEFHEFQKGAHPSQNEITTFVLKAGMNLNDLSESDFLRLRTRNPGIFQAVDSHRQRGVE